MELVRIDWNRDVQRPQFVGEYQCAHRSGPVDAVVQVPIACPACNRSAEAWAARMFGAETRRLMAEVRQLMAERDTYRLAFEALLEERGKENP